MNRLAREKLCYLTSRFGHSIGSDPRRCEALLKDVCGEFKKEIFVLVSAAREGVPGELISGTRGMPVSIVVPRLAKRLHQQLGIAEGLCYWTVETWAIALSLSTEQEFAQRTPCPACSNAIRVPHELYGRLGSCPKCTARLRISGDGKLALLPLNNESEHGGDFRYDAQVSSNASSVDAGVGHSDTQASDTPIDVFRQLIRCLISQSSWNHELFEIYRESLGLEQAVAMVILQEELNSRANGGTRLGAADVEIVTATLVDQTLPAEWSVMPPDGVVYGPIRHMRVPSSVKFYLAIGLSFFVAFFLGIINLIVGVFLMWNVIHSESKTGSHTQVAGDRLKKRETLAILNMVLGVIWFVVILFFVIGV